VAVLFVLVQLLHDHGLAQLLETATGSGNDVADLLRLTALAAAGANTVNNLPAYLAMEPLAARWPLRMAALLIGVNTGPLITPWASLATLLWAGRCRAAGVTISWHTFALRGLILVPVLLLASIGALVGIHA
jgi:arsenical pump membrane protein